MSGMMMRTLAEKEPRLKGAEVGYYGTPGSRPETGVRYYGTGDNASVRDTFKRFISAFKKLLASGAELEDESWRIILSSKYPITTTVSKEKQTMLAIAVTQLEYDGVDYPVYEHRLQFIENLLSADKYKASSTANKKTSKLISMQDINGYTPLARLADEGSLLNFDKERVALNRTQLAIAKLLLKESGGTQKDPDKIARYIMTKIKGNGLNALVLAIVRKHTQLALELLQYPVDLSITYPVYNRRTNTGESEENTLVHWNILLIACYHHDIKVIEAILKKAPELLHDSCDGMTAEDVMQQVLEEAKKSTQSAQDCATLLRQAHDPAPPTMTPMQALSQLNRDDNNQSGCSKTAVSKKRKTVSL